MDAGKFDKQVFVMQHTRDANGDFMWLPVRKMWAALTETDRSCVYSNFAFGTKAAQIDTRYCTIPCGTLVRYKDDTYMVTSCITDRMYAHIQAAKVVNTQCICYRHNTVKDNLNKQRSELGRLFSFPAVIGEKYVRPIEYITHGEVKRGVVLTTNKDIELLEGDIVKAGDDTYIIRACHTLDPDKNDYEAERRRDV